MKKMSDKELKREFESPRNRLNFAMTGLVFLALAVGAFLILLFDPFGWLAGPPALHEAKKWLAICICFVWLPLLAGIWLMVIRPLQIGIVTGGSKYRAPYIVLRSEEPARFRRHIIWNCILLTAGFTIATFMLVSFIRDFQKAKAEPPNTALEPTALGAFSSAVADNGFLRRGSAFGR